MALQIMSEISIRAGDQMAVEIMRKRHIVTDKGAYLDAVIDQLSDGDLEWLNEDFPDEENKSVAFKPLI
ncbi:MAG: hypothetical protein PHN61_00290 [Methanothrix sp.]|nr:hypothetical protein [Methanothrix sp.]